MAQGVVLSEKNLSSTAALVWRNMGDLEEQIYEREQEWNEQKTTFEGMQAALEQGGLRVLNRPNLLNNNFWTSRDMPSSAVISETLNIPAETAAEAAANLTFTVSNNAITSSYKLHGIKIANKTIVPYISVSAAFVSGSATVTLTARNNSAAHDATTITVYLCTTSSQQVVYGSATRISGSTYPYLKSISGGNYPGDDSDDGIACSVATLKPNDYSTSSAYAVNAKCARGTKEYRCTTAIGSGGEAWNAAHWEEIPAEWIIEPDGEQYPKAIQYAITANSAYGNTEWLMFYNPNTTSTYYSDVTPAANVKNYGQINEMIPGRTYTMSCWVKVLSGDGVWMRFGYGNSYTNSPYNDTTNHRVGISDIVKVDANGNTWQRVSWTFEYNPVGDWYTETSTQETVSGVTHTKVTRSYNYYKKVHFGVLRKHTATVQICGFRLVEGRLFVCDTYADLLDRVVNIENGDEAIMSNFGNAENQTAASAHIEGEVFRIGNTVYRAAAAIAAGDTIATSGAGANATIVTMAELIGEKADAQAMAGAVSAILANLASTDTATATAAHAAGDVILVGGQLYKVTTAVAIGDTITATGNAANVEAVTVASLLAPLLALTSASGVSF